MTPGIRDPNGLLNTGVGTDPLVTDALNKAAANVLPPDYWLRPRVGPGTHTYQTYTGGVSQVPKGQAIDAEIVDPQGNVVGWPGYPHPSYGQISLDQMRQDPGFQMYEKLGREFIVQRHAQGQGGRYGGFYGKPDPMQFGTEGPGYPRGINAPPELYGGTAGTGGTQTVNASTTTPQGPDNRQLLYDMLTKNLQLTPRQAVGFIWGMAGESGPGLNAGAQNLKDPGGAFGMGQWILDRKQDLTNFAAAQNGNVSDPRLQVAFIQHELTGKESAALTAIRGASTEADAAHAETTMYERPKVDNSETRIARGPQSASLDANGNLVLPHVAAGATSTPAGGTAPAPSTTTPGGQQQQPIPYPVTTPGMSVGQTLAGLANAPGIGGGGGGVGGYMDTSADQPAIRMPALATETPGPSPIPLQFQGGIGSSPLASQLGALASMPNPATNEMTGDPGSITAGAPSMTGMLGTLGTPAEFNYLDPRRTISPSLTMRSPRLA